jgi:NAD(P)-dependent dehydrogenase (short-subunit alcohol dehydrogenase family)
VTTNETVAVFGAYGHTGRFVVSELRKRGWTAILSGRDPDKLNALGSVHPGLDRRPASVDDAASLDRALAGAAAVINCAGPFARTSAPLIEAAFRARIPYLDVAAEIEANADTFEHYAGRAREAGIAIVPAMAFYGGLGDLLATAAMGDWKEADDICIAYALSSWKPTLGTRATTEVSRQRRDGRRIVFSNHRLELRTDDAPILSWTFPAPIGTQTVVGEFTMADSVTIPRHIRTPAIRTYMTLAPLMDLDDPDLSPPPAADESGRSAQTFLVEVVARSGHIERRAVARGRDIYAVTAPLVVEAAQRVVARHADSAGVFAAGEIFDAEDFLMSLCPAHLSVEIHR